MRQIFAFLIAVTTFISWPQIAASETLYGVATNNTLVRFESETPGTLTDSVAITGLQSGENILGLDFRPLDGALFAIGSTSQVYTINLSTGAVTAVGAAFGGLSGTAFGVDFNPVADRIRIVSELDQNLRVNPSTGALTATDTNLAYDAGDANTGQNPSVVASGYTNNKNGATSTTLFGIDSALDILVRQGSPNANPSSPNTGLLFTVGALGVDTTDQVGFDVAPALSGRAFASLTAADTISRLYSIDLTGGAATLIGIIGTNASIRDIAVLPGGSLDFTESNFVVSESAGTATITVIRSGGSTGSVTVDVASSNGTAAAGSDYTTASTTLTFAEGDVSETFSVAITEDLTAENNENFTLTLSNVTGGADIGGSGSALVTIGDNDQTSVTGAPSLLVAADPTITRRVLYSRRGLESEASCSEACTLNATLTVPSRIRRRARLDSSTIGTATATLSQAGKTDLSVVLEESIRRALRIRGGRYTATLTVTATDTDGNVTTETISIRVS